MQKKASRIFTEPALLKKLDLDDLLRRITRKNLHEEADFGPAAGKEIW
jgi:antitoxin component of MazEF toxin-antitoxin module